MNALFHRLRVLLGQSLSGPEARNSLGPPCATCGEPASGWSYVAHDRNGQRVIDGYATCAAHQAEESLQETAGTQAS